MPQSFGPSALMRLIKSRRSVRTFRSDAVPEGHLRLILEAARCAPTAGNEQSWRFLVVREKSNIERLRAGLVAWNKKRFDELCPESERREERLKEITAQLDKTLSTPVLVFVFVDTSKHPDLVGYDGALAVENMMLMARALGYGSCFMTSFFPERVVREAFHIPEGLRFVCAVPIGRPTEWPSPPEKKQLRELMLHEEIQALPGSETIT